MTSFRPTDAELLADSANPAESFARFYRRHAEAILRFAASRGADDHTAADVVAETFFVALERRAEYQAAHETARLWLLGIAYRRLAEIRRFHQRERVRLQRYADQVGVLTDADRETYAALLEDNEAMDALSDLPEPERLAVLARVVEDRSYAEIAEALGLSEEATRKRVSRGLSRLRTRLERN